MKTHFITVDNAWPAILNRNTVGTMPATEYFPVHGFASDLHYSLLPDGVLANLFRIESPERLMYGLILKNLPPSSGVQVYSHHAPGAADSRYLALSSLVPYRTSFSPLHGFASLLSGYSMAREIEQLEAATRETYETLRRAAEIAGPGLSLLGSPTPLLETLGPVKINGVALEGQGPVAYNLSYLRLGPARLAMLIAFNAFPAPRAAEIPRPPADLEYLAATCVHLPMADDLAKLDSEVEDYLTFLHYFRKSTARPASGFPDPGQVRGEQVLTLKGKVLAKHYVLLFGSNLEDLRTKTHAYFRDLCKAGISFHANMIRTRENYSHLYPGCFRLLHDGVRVDVSDVPAIVNRLHP
jgi:hypothetical protein